MHLSLLFDDYASFAYIHSLTTYLSLSYLVEGTPVTFSFGDYASATLSFADDTSLTFSFGDYPSVTLSFGNN